MGSYQGFSRVFKGCSGSLGFFGLLGFLEVFRFRFFLGSRVLGLWLLGFRV